MPHFKFHSQFSRLASFPPLHRGEPTQAFRFFAQGCIAAAANHCLVKPVGDLGVLGGEPHACLLQPCGQLIRVVVHEFRS